MYQIPIIYCLLITGKNDERYKFIDIAIENFNQQTYQHKFLIIVNHGKKSLINKETSNIKQVFFDKQHLTLGDMRNFSLDLVPFNGYWTIWDDDDWRHKRYLELLMKNLIDNKADTVFLKNRLDVNLNNGFVYRCKFDKGMPFLMTKKIENIRYLAKESLEDIRLFNDYELNKKKIHLIDNDPRWYIRTIHGSNTSLFVNHEKDSIVNYSKDSFYHEFEATESEKNYTNKIIQTYYKDV